MLYITDTNIRLASIENVNPDTIVIASGCNISAPSPIPKASGDMPTTVVKVVMSIGRNLNRAASIIASFWLIPRLRTISIFSTKTGLAWRILIHAAKGSWNNSRQCNFQACKEGTLRTLDLNKNIRLLCHQSSHSQFKFLSSQYRLFFCCVILVIRILQAIEIVF